MIVLIQGSAGSGKTWLMSRLLKAEWKRGTKIYPNFPLWYDDQRTNIQRWHNLDETFSLENGIIAIDESQKFLDARKWASLPVAFTEKIAMHRHHHIDMYTTTQDFGHIDVRMRTNVHEMFKCESLIRFPINQRYRPVFQVIKSQRFKRSFDSNRVRWVRQGMPSFHFISKFWTKTYYNTYGDVGKEDYVCKLIYEKKVKTKEGDWIMKLYARELVESGKARM